MATQNDERNDSSDRTADSTPTASGRELRRLAEEKAGVREDLAAEPLSAEAAGRLLHELRVQQIELELQNEELRRAQEVLEESRARFIDLYDFAPVGYITVSEQGLLLEANLTAAALLGAPRGALIRQPLSRFILPDDQDIYYRHRRQLFETEEPQTYKLRLLRSDGPPFWARLEAIISRQGKHESPVCRVVLTDISERQRMEEKLRENEERFRLLFERTPLGYQSLDAAGHFLEVNQAWLELLGYEREEVIGRWFGDFLPPDYVEAFRQRFPRFKEAGEVHNEFEMKHKNGSIVTVAFDGKIGYDEQGQFKQTHCILRDITERKQAEESLRQAEERYHRLFSEMMSGAALHEIICDDQGNAIDYVTLEVNTAYIALLNASREAVVGQKASMFLSPEELRHWLDIFGPVALTGASVKYEMYSPINQKYFEGAAYCPEKGKFAVTFTEVTERKRAEESLRESQKRLAESNQLLAGVLEHTHMMAVFLDPQFNFIWVNRAYAATCRQEPDFFPGKNHFDLYPHPENQAIFQQVVDTGEPFFAAAKAFEFPDQPERGVTYWDWSLIPIIDVDRVTGLVFTLAEVTERVRTEESLRRVNELLEIAQQASQAGAWNWNVATGQIEWSPELFTLFGLNPAEHTASFDNWRMVLHPADKEVAKERIITALREKKPLRSDYRIVRPNGQQCWINALGRTTYDEAGQPLHMAGICVDITARKQAEEERLKLERQLWQAQKAESLGRMAGAIAHHFNNLLGAVMGNLELAMMELTQAIDAGPSLAEAMTAARRAAEISRLMLAYLGQRAAQPERVDLAAVCRTALPLLNAFLPGKAHLRTDLPEPGPLVQVDVAQLHQVLTNLLVNAAESIGEKEGEISITISLVAAAKLSTVQFYPPDWQPQAESYACLVVADNGNGLTPEIIEQIFDPFFSTKFTGRGLGLPVALGIVKAHQGAITVAGEPGQGAVFQVLLPVVAQPAPPPPQAEPLPGQAGPTAAIPARVLLVEDEPMVRRVAQAMLQGLGHTVIPAADGVEAVTILADPLRADRIDCVLLDLTTPHASGTGWETLAALRQVRPDLAVILTSGYDEAQVMAGAVAAKWPQAFLAKPYTQADLQAALDTALRKKGMVQT